MRKREVLIPFLCIIISLFLTACGQKKTEDKSENQEKTAKQEQAREEFESFRGSMQDIISQGKAVKCTYSGESEMGDNYSGTLYAAGNKARQDTKGEHDGRDTQIHIIVDDRAVYLWTSENPGRGMKMAVEEDDEGLKELAEDIEEAGQDRQWQQEFDYKCSKWKTDHSKFELPDGIDFMDMRQLIEQRTPLNVNDSGRNTDAALENAPITPEAPDGFDIDGAKEQMCAICETTPDPAECKAGLGCD